MMFRIYGRLLLTIAVVVAPLIQTNTALGQAAGQIGSTAADEEAKRLLWLKTQVGSSAVPKPTPAAVKKRFADSRAFQLRPLESSPGVTPAPKNRSAEIKTPGTKTAAPITPKAAIAKTTPSETTAEKSGSSEKPIAASSATPQPTKARTASSSAQSSKTPATPAAKPAPATAQTAKKPSLEKEATSSGRTSSATAASRAPDPATKKAGTPEKQIAVSSPTPQPAKGRTASSTTRSAKPAATPAAKPTPTPALTAKKSAPEKELAPHRRTSGVAAETRANETRGSDLRLTDRDLVKTSRSTTSTKKSSSRYPWKTGIVTTVFWVGERPSGNNFTPNYASSWDVNWSRNYGGFDNPDPDMRRNFIPVKFTPRQNPFYVALPYNDVTRGTTKPEARRVIPWFKEAFEREGQSVCRDRWVAIRNRCRQSRLRAVERLRTFPHRSLAIRLRQGAPEAQPQPGRRPRCFARRARLTWAWTAPTSPTGNLSIQRSPPRPVVALRGEQHLRAKGHAIEEREHQDRQIVGRRRHAYFRIVN